MKRMNASWYCSSRVYSMLILIFLLIVAPSYCQEDEYYSQCAKPFNCGNLRNLSYPFWREGRPEICGFEGFKLRCRDGELAVITIESLEFIVKYVNQPHKMMTIAPRVLWDNPCLADSAFNNITLNTDRFSYTQDFSSLFSNISLFYNCSNLESDISPAQKFQCLINGENRDAFYGYDGLGGGWRQEISKCTVTVQVPVPKWTLGENLLNDLGDVLKEGFSIGYKYDENCDRCRESRGICGTGIANSGFTCLCSDHSHPVSCSAVIGSRRIIVQKIIVAVGVVVALLACTFIVLRIRRLQIGLVIRRPQLFQSTRKNKDFEAFLEKHGPLAVRRYRYSQVKKMTNSFAEKLGQGGYGTVYKGTLLDGHLVAVKMLNASKGEGKEFLNEVAAISRTSHVNIVALLGFCLEGEERALVYEFMPNGSLDKLICHQGQQLDWEIVHQIVIGIAQGLEYLHRGCNTRIVHFDIKPHNILLDQNLNPKISDFGLAKICTRKESAVSMLEARGTIGYIAPEVFCRNFGQVSSKSDVYSYGMMILEIVGARKINSQQVEGNNSSEMYFPNWIYKSLEMENEGKDITEDDDIVRKLKLIGLWCIQTNSSERPTMSDVIEMLQGHQIINVPPKPFPSSPQFPMFSSTTSTS